MQYFRILPNEIDDMYFHQVAELHIAAITGGVLERIGVKALAKLYRILAASGDNVVIVATEHGKLAGFISGCLDVRAIIKRLLLSPGFILLTLSSPDFWRGLCMAIKALAYPQNVTKAEANGDGVMAELFSVAVSREWRKRKIGTHLMEELEGWFREKNIAAYRVSTDAADAGANAFYQKNGGVFTAAFRHHTMTLNTYHIQLVPAVKQQSQA